MLKWTNSLTSQNNPTARCKYWRGHISSKVVSHCPFKEISTSFEFLKCLTMSLTMVSFGRRQHCLGGSATDMFIFWSEMFGINVCLYGFIVGYTCRFYLRFYIVYWCNFWNFTDKKWIRFSLESFNWSRPAKMSKRIFFNVYCLARQQFLLALLATTTNHQEEDNWEAHKDLRLWRVLKSYAKTNSS